MSSNQDLLDVAYQAEKDLNSYGAKQGLNSKSASGVLTSLSLRGGLGKPTDSGIDESVTSKFPGSTAVSGSAASGAGGNREIPVEEGGSISNTGRPTKARDFEGKGGPEDKQQAYAVENPGNDDVRDNIRQGGETRRP